ncbi:MAG: hypothetical protein HOQ11_13405 [Gemmatimonadaceae bacterium]|nr:hypothetical protein [Gemmatimonadaceae bacterium]NUQ94097.1 hypothetical protein [Gemmatimonadaceae bacterium]NUR18005.1 hypothetical protein [Gemmatimonadaceae bacterium]NUS98396.1 hypothetical protein [Gemmatimonadaceae bacterium]
MNGSPTSSRLREPHVDQLGPADVPVTCGARAIATRIRSLIAHEDGGDVCAAARRLGVPVRQLVQLDTTLAPDCPEARAACEALLAAVTLRYQASATWLLTGSHHPDPGAVSPDVAERLAGVCHAIAGRVAEDVTATSGAGAPYSL